MEELLLAVVSGSNCTCRKEPWLTEKTRPIMLIELVIRELIFGEVMKIQAKSLQINYIKLQIKYIKLLHYITNRYLYFHRMQSDQELPSQ